MNDAAKLDSTSNDGKKRGRSLKFKLACCSIILGLGIVTVLVIVFLWYAGHIQKFGCRFVEKDSSLGRRFNCAVGEIKEQGEGEYKYNVIDPNDQNNNSSEENVVDVVEKSSQSVVAIGVRGVGNEEDQIVGTGFIVTSNGLILTNQHVVSDRAAKYYVLVKGEEQQIEAVKIYRDVVNDIAIIKINKTDLAAIPLGDSDKLKAGQSVIAIGNPLGTFQGTVTTGIISGLNRDVQVGSEFSALQGQKYTDVIQTDAAINPGNSGGPLINSRGEVIGVNFATIQGASNLSFALPINKAKQRIEELNKYGDFRIPYLGIEYSQRVVFIKGQAVVGAVVLNVIENSPAAAAGIQKGDVIVNFNGKDLDDQSLSSLIQSTQIDQEIEVIILRDKVEQTLKVKVGQRGS